MANVLIVVDYQNDFVDGALGFEGAELLSGGIVNHVNDALKQGDPVYLTLDTHFEDYMDTAEGKRLPIPHCIKGTKGHELYGALASYADAPGVTVIEKPTFGSVDLAKAILDAHGKGPHTFHLMGLVTNICVLSNAALLKAAFPESEFIIHGDLCGGGDKALHEKGLDVMEGLLMTVIR
ncbi:MAG: cysteine hydrolase [Clostridiales bacterium]|nr:cysteine hydrolase [Clostridiales bacterium]